jgi:uncharacterized protein YycO
MSSSGFTLVNPGVNTKALLTLAFYQEDPDNERLDRLKEHSFGCMMGPLRTWNRVKSQVTAWWVREEGCQFGHVELMFSDGSAASSTEKTGVHYDTDRVLSNDGYTNFLTVTVTMSQQTRMQQFIAQRVGRPFNSAGRLWNNVGCLRDCFGMVDTEDRSYYCSELITTVLQLAGLCKDLDPRCTNPTQLYLYLKKSGEGRLGYNAKETRLSQPTLPKRRQNAFSRVLLALPEGEEGV